MLTNLNEEDIFVLNTLVGDDQNGLNFENLEHAPVQIISSASVLDKLHQVDISEELCRPQRFM